MHRVFVFCCLLFFALLPFSSAVKAAEMSIDDLLVPEVYVKDEMMGDSQSFNQRSENQVNLDDLLGPKDNFPFLPDNHRDSGTGKFNNF